MLAQDASAIEKLAQRTAEELVKRKPTVLLVAPRESCSLDSQICKTFDSTLRSDLQQEIPGIRFVGNAEAIRDLKRNGFYSIDAYDPSAWRLVAVSEGSEIVVTEDLWWEKNGYSLRIDVRESKTGKRLAVAAGRRRAVRRRWGPSWSHVPRWTRRGPGTTCTP